MAHELPAELHREVGGQAPTHRRREGGAVQPAHLHLGPRRGAVDDVGQARDGVAGRVFEERQRPHLGVRHAGGDAQLVAHGPEAEEPDAILAQHRLAHALVERQLPLARVADVGGDGGERVLAGQLRQHADPVVEDGEHRLAALAEALDGDVRGLLVERVLHQLGDGLARVRLAARQVANELEGVVNADVPHGRAVGLLAGSSRHAAMMGAGRPSASLRTASRRSRRPTIEAGGIASSAVSAQVRCMRHLQRLGVAGVRGPEPLERR